VSFEKRLFNQTGGSDSMKTIVIGSGSTLDGQFSFTHRFTARERDNYNLEIRVGNARCEVASLVVD